MAQILASPHSFHSARR